MNQLIVGDIHGCYAELQDLLDKAGLAASDEIIALGDVVDRGPDSVRVIDLIRHGQNVRCIQGNHERKHVQSWRGRVRPALSQLITRRQIGDAEYPAVCEFVATLPTFLELSDAVVVHGFYEPGVPLYDQRDTVLTGTLSGERYLKDMLTQPWYELYDGDKPLLVGHHDYSGRGRPFVHRELVFGLDTGCCHGGQLTGILLPEFRFVSVPSRRDYWTELKQEHADIRYQTTPLADLSWESADDYVCSGRRQQNPSNEVQHRISHIEQLLVDAEQALTPLFDTIVQKHAEIVAQLRNDCFFDDLSSKEQGRVYANLIGNSPLSPFLHRIRRGRMSAGDLRNYFGKPAKLLEFVRQLKI